MNARLLVTVPGDAPRQVTEWDRMPDGKIAMDTTAPGVTLWPGMPIGKVRHAKRELSAVFPAFAFRVEVVR